MASPGTGRRWWALAVLAALGVAVWLVTRPGTPAPTRAADAHLAGARPRAAESADWPVAATTRAPEPIEAPAPVALERPPVPPAMPALPAPAPATPAPATPTRAPVPAIVTATTPAASASADGGLPALRSPRSTAALEITVDNTCDHEIELIWLDFKGDERSYGYIQSGAMRTVPTYEGHQWRLRMRADNLDLTTFAAQPDGYVEACPRGTPHYTSVRVPLTPPHDPPKQCSQQGGRSLDLFVDNTCTRPIKLTWVDFDCSLHAYHELAPGERYHQGTYAHHVWRAVDADQHTLVEMTAEEDNDRLLVSCPAGR